MANKENIQKWVDALRSGEYVQGYGCLEYTEDDVRKNCCLGVATRVYMKENPEAIDTSTENGSVIDHRKAVGYKTEFHFTEPYESYEEDVLPPEVRDWYGLDRDNPKFPDEFGIEARSAIHCNDEENMNFNEIADLIEKQYLDDSGN